MKYYIIFFATLFTVSFAGCNKTEFMPPPEGEAIPYEDTKYANLETVLKNSPYKLFYKVWEKSTLSSLLIGKAPYTLLVPADEAMIAGGFTEAAINTMTAAEADRLTRYYTIEQRITEQNIQENIGNMRTISMLEKAGWRIAQPYAYDQRNVPFRYLHYLGLENGSLLINGIPMGKDAALPASNGYIWPIKSLISMVDKTFKEIMESDPRFSMMIEIKKRLDAVYDDEYRYQYEANTGWDPGSGADYNKQYYNKLPLTQTTTSGGFIVNTVFLPTNDAFIKAGFNTVDEIVDWNKNLASEMVFDPNTWAISGGGMPTDTILAYHYDWGRDNLPYSGQWGKAPDPVPAVFYQNDLKNDLLANVSLNNRVGDMQYFMPFSFGRDAQGRVLVQIKGSDAAQATIIETINTAMGPLHVVDRLFIPKGLKMR